jgi:glutamate/tyrosine decarboxylase-like PLP-dependent enzyme
VVCGAEAHSSVFKALGIVGLGRSGGRNVLRLPVDSQGAVRASAVAGRPPPSSPTIVILQAGHFNTGDCDDLAALIAWARSGGAGRQVWVHIDGAFGLWAAASADAKTRALVAGSHLADSWAVDLHKLLNVPYDSAIVAVRDGAHLDASMGCVAPYAPPSTSGTQPKELTSQCQNSRRARGIVAWATLRHLGRGGVASMIDSFCRRACRFAEALERGGATVLNKVVFNQVLVSFGDDARTAAVVACAQEDGRCWVGATRYRGSVVMRISVASWATGDTDIDVSARAILECASRIKESEGAEDRT